MAGALGAFFIGQIAYDQYSLDLAIGYVAMIIIGGTGSILGWVIGAIVITDIPFVLQSAGANTSGTGFLSRNLSWVELAINAVLLIVFLLVEPRGLVHLGIRLRGTLARLRRPGGREAAGAQPAAPQPGAGRRRGEPAGGTGRSPWAAGSRGRDACPGRCHGAGQPLLRVDRLTVNYHGSKLAVDAVSLEVGRSEIVGIIGPNGAGRTSLLAGIAGLAPTQAAGLYLNGKPLNGLGTMERAQRGLILVPEREKVFPQLTVAEHLEPAASGRTRDRHRQREVIAAAVGYFPGLQPRLGIRAAT